jgi:hypothetical protein
VEVAHAGTRDAEFVDAVGAGDVAQAPDNLVLCHS